MLANINNIAKRNQLAGEMTAVEMDKNIQEIINVINDVSNIETILDGPSGINLRVDNVEIAINELDDTVSTISTKNKIYRQAISPTIGLIQGDMWFDSDDDNHVYYYDGAAWVSTRDGAIADAIATATAAATLADSKIVTYVQANAPTGDINVGDLWFDTDDGNKQYRHNGVNWIQISDATIQLAYVTAQNAQVTADGKITTYYQNSEPSTGMDIGDLWFDLDDGNKLYRYNGSAWISIQDTAIAQALASADNALATADGKIQTFYQISEPTSLESSVGDLWFDTDNGNRMHRYSGTQWNVAQDSAIGQAINDAADALAIADGKIATFVQSTSPTADSVGDLWYNTNTNSVTRWNGTAWVNFATYSDLTTLVAGNGDMIANNLGLIAAPDGRPAGVRSSNGNITPTDISYLDKSLGHIRLYSAVDNTTCMAYPAFRIQPNTKYTLRSRVKSNVAASNGFTLFITEYDTDTLPDGVTHINNTSMAGEGNFFVSGTRPVTFASNVAITTTFISYEYTYTPTSTAKWASVHFLNGAGMGFNELHVALCSLLPVINSDATVNHVYRQSTAPSTGMVLGDLWINTGSSNSLYYYSGSAWVSSRDLGIEQALTNAATAQAAADGKITTYFQSTPPNTNLQLGDLWFDTDDGNSLYRYSGIGWVVAQDSAIADATLLAVSAQATADGKIETYFQSTAPSSGMGIGDLWYNTTTKIVTRWNGTTWLTFSDETKGALDAGVTTTGGITLSTNGLIKSEGKATLIDGVEGFLLGDIGGDKVLYVGDGVEDYIKYQEGTGFEIGSDVKLKGVLSLNSNDTFFSVMEPSGFWRVAGNATNTQMPYEYDSNSKIYLNMVGLTAAVGHYSQIQYSLSQATLNIANWSNDFFWSAAVVYDSGILTSTAKSSAAVGIGNVFCSGMTDTQLNSVGVGFRIIRTGTGIGSTWNVVAFSANGSARTEVQIYNSTSSISGPINNYGTGTSTVNNCAVFRIKKIGNSITFYITTASGYTYSTTIITNIPEGTEGLGAAITACSRCVVANSAYYSGMAIGEFRLARKS